MHAESGNALRKEEQWWAHLLPVRAPRPHQSRLRLLQPYNGTVESEERNYFSSSPYDRRLRSLPTNCLCSRRGSEVGHSFWSVTPHVQWPQQLLNVHKALTSHSNQTRRLQLSHCHALYLPQHHTGLSTRSPLYPYCSTFPSIDQPIGFCPGVRLYFRPKHAPQLCHLPAFSPEN